MNVLKAHRSLGSVLLVAALLNVGCSDSEGRDATPDPASPVYAVATRLFSGGGSEATIVVGFVFDLESGQLDLSNTVGVGSSGDMWAYEGAGEFYVARGEDLSLSKYRYEDGRPVFVDRVSLAQSLESLEGSTMVFDGPDRGYLLQMREGEGLEVNLDGMEVVRPLDLTALLDPEFPTFITTETIRDGQVIASTYGTDPVQETVSDVSQILFFDPSSGTFETRPAPCGGLANTMQASSGDIYFASDPWVAGIHAIDPSRAPAPCLVRLPANSREPDPNPIRLNDLTGGTTGGLIPTGGSSMWVRVLDTERFPITQETTSFQLFVSPAWNTWRIDLERPEEALPVERAPLSGAILFFEVDGQVYDNDTASDLSSTTLVRTTGPGAPARGVRIAGVPLSVARIR